MTTLTEYQERIHKIAKEKGWSDSLIWLMAKTSVEYGEWIIEVERNKKYEDELFEKGASEAYTNSVLAPQRLKLAKEFGDVVVCLFQTMHHFPIDLDEALEITLKEIASNKKKTIDAEGRIVSK